jgi:glyoxylase-like metal-dependent hydrolase (beta-lactamase superfamily II)
LRRVTIGDFEVTVLSDGTYELDGGAFFGVVPKVLWEKRVQSNARNMLKVGTNCLLLRDGKQTVLIETGIGSKLSEKAQAIHKNHVRLMKDFAEAGVSPDEVDIVINTHLHFDHLAGTRITATARRCRRFRAPSITCSAARWNTRTNNMSATG